MSDATRTDVLSRRQLLAAFGGGLFAVQLGGCTGSDSESTRPRDTAEADVSDAPPRWSEWFWDPAAVADFGGLVDEQATHVAAAVAALRSLGADRARGQAAALVTADFDADRVVTIDGWTLAATESAVALLVAEERAEGT